MNKDQFQKLKVKWYKKLKGFNDIETHTNDLKQYSFRFFSNKEENTFSYEFKERYYQLAGQFKYSPEYSYFIISHRQRKYGKKYELVWRLHTEGLRVADIAAQSGLLYAQVYAMISEMSKVMLESNSKDVIPNKS